MGKPDALSRREDHAMRIQDNNKMVLVIPPEQIASTTLHIETDSDEIQSNPESEMLRPESEKRISSDYVRNTEFVKRETDFSLPGPEKCTYPKTKISGWK